MQVNVMPMQGNKEPPYYVQNHATNEAYMWYTGSCIKGVRIYVYVTVCCIASDTSYKSKLDHHIQSSSAELRPPNHVAIMIAAKNGATTIATTVMTTGRKARGQVEKMHACIMTRSDTVPTYGEEYKSTAATTLEDQDLNVIVAPTLAYQAPATTRHRNGSLLRSGELGFGYILPPPLPYRDPSKMLRD